MKESWSEERIYEPEAGREFADKGNWIQNAIKKPGALRSQLGAQPGQNIPAAKLAKAAKKGGTLGRRARLAQTLQALRSKK